MRPQEKKKLCAWSSQAIFGLLAVLLVLCAAGCPPKKKKTAKALPPGKCRTDKDCGPKKRCIDGDCKECKSDAHCKPAEKCVDGRCRKRCTKDRECPDGQVCVEGACKKKRCRKHGDCGSGRICRDGQCMALKKGLCREDDDCSEEEVCRNGRCVPAPRPGAEPDLCKLENIYFAYNKYTLPKEGGEILQKNAACLGKVPSRVVQIEGHCDQRGTEEYNLALSNERAQTVMKYLVRLGVKASRLRVVPKGELEAKGTNEDTWAKDRKVVFVWY